ncbi:hypothetical protein [Lutispora sp.]
MGQTLPTPMMNSTGWRRSSTHRLELKPTHMMRGTGWYKAL